MRRGSTAKKHSGFISAPLRASTRYRARNDGRQCRRQRERLQQQPRATQQARATKLVELFLDVAEDLFAEVSFEAATMTAVAERSGSSIGALYNYFPDKTSLAKALLEKYRAKTLTSWKPPLERIGELSHRQFADQMVERLIDVVTAHPAYL